MFDSYKQFVRFKGGAKTKREPVVVKYDRIERETGQAVLIIIKNQPYWFPISQVTLYNINNTIEVPQWLAIKKGLSF